VGLADDIVECARPVFSGGDLVIHILYRFLGRWTANDVRSLFEHCEKRG
jgi:hypothetical protein